MNSTILREYLRERRPHFQQFLEGTDRVFQTPANTVLRHAKIRAAWAEHGCWYFTYAGMYHGIEPDGYIHT